MRMRASKRKAHGIERIVESVKSKQSDAQSRIDSLMSSLRKRDGYQAMFKHKKGEVQPKKAHFQVEIENSNVGEQYLSAQNQKHCDVDVDVGADEQSLFGVDDVDLKSPEDNDSVAINPKDSIDIDCSKMSFSTVYNSNLLPLQSVLATQNQRALPRKYEIQTQSKSKSRVPRPNKTLNFAKNKRSLTQQSTVSHRFPKTRNLRSSSSSAYGIKLPRLTRSILAEKDRMDSNRRGHGILEAATVKSTFSAPSNSWRRNLKPNQNQNANAKRRRVRMATRVIDEEREDCDSEYSVSAHLRGRESNNTMFLPRISRSKLRPKAKYKYNQRRPSEAQSVRDIAENDILREENALEQSLLRLNERLSNLTPSDAPPRGEGRDVDDARSVMSAGKRSGVPRKRKVKKAPTFKSKRERRRWPRNA